LPVVLVSINASKSLKILPNLGPTAGKIWRIGTFGINSNPEDINALKLALKSALYEQNEKKVQLKAAI
jgi:aspartate aminotransferase-like enzyme